MTHEEAQARLELREAQGFDLSRVTEADWDDDGDTVTEWGVRVRCSCCEVVHINGMPCHETRCPNMVRDDVEEVVCDGAHERGEPEAVVVAVELDPAKVPALAVYGSGGQPLGRVHVDHYDGVVRVLVWVGQHEAPSAAVTLHETGDRDDGPTEPVVA